MILKIPQNTDVSELLSTLYKPGLQMFFETSIFIALSFKVQ